jgi:3-deoxy-D-arabino-heptulosonate 7-phosphate (DAHP) synthase
MIEIHPDPENALSDGPQSLAFDEFKALARELPVPPNTYVS